MIDQALQDCVQQFGVLLDGLGIDDNVVEIVNRAFVEVRAQDLLQDPLKGGARVFEPHGHDEPLVVTLVGDKCCLFDTIWVHFDLPVAPCDVQGGEVSCSA